MGTSLSRSSTNARAHTHTGGNPYPQEGELNHLGELSVADKCFSVSSTQELLKELIVLIRDEAAGNSFVEACASREEMYGEVMAMGGRNQELLVPVAAACSRGTGRFDMVGVGSDAALEGEVQRAVFAYLRLLTDAHKKALCAHLNASGKLVSSKNAVLDLFVQVGDGTMNVEGPEVVLPVLAAVTLAVFKPVDLAEGALTPRHVVLGGLLGDDIIKAVELGQPRHYAKGRTDKIDVMLPALKSLEDSSSNNNSVNIVAHPDTHRRYNKSRYNTTLTYTSVTQLQDLPVALGVLAGEIGPAGGPQVDRSAPMQLPTTNEPTIGRFFPADTVRQERECDEEGSEGLLGMRRTRAHKHMLNTHIHTQNKLGHHGNAAHPAPHPRRAGAGERRPRRPAQGHARAKQCRGGGGGCGRGRRPVGVVSARHGAAGVPLRLLQ